MAISSHSVQVDGHRNTTCLLEGSEVDNGKGVLVVRRHISSGVSNIECVAYNLEFVRLITDETGAHNLERGGVELSNITDLRLGGIGDDRTGIRGDIAVSVLERQIAAVRDLYGADMFGRAGIHDLDEIRGIDDGVEPVAVDLKVITHITQRLRDIGIGSRVDIAGVGSRSEVVVVKCGLVRAHIALVEQVAADDLGLHDFAFLFLFGRENDFIRPTAI